MQKGMVVLHTLTKHMCFVIWVFHLQTVNEHILLHIATWLHVTESLLSSIKTRCFLLFQNYAIARCFESIPACVQLAFPLQYHIHSPTTHLDAIRKCLLPNYWQRILFSWFTLTSSEAWLIHSLWSFCQLAFKVMLNSNYIHKNLNCFSTTHQHLLCTLQCIWSVWHSLHWVSHSGRFHLLHLSCDA